jgi:hypothetical protein
LEGAAAAAALDASSSHETPTVEAPEDHEARSSASSTCSSFGIGGESVTLAYETDMEATMEMDVDSGDYLRKKMKKVSFRYVEAARRAALNDGAKGGADGDEDDASLSSLSGIYVDGGAVSSDEENDAPALPAAPPPDQLEVATSAAAAPPSLPVDTDSLLTADQVGMMPSEIGTCAVVGLSSPAEDGRTPGDGAAAKDERPWSLRSLLARRTGGSAA